MLDIVNKQPAKSTLILTDLTDAHYNSTSARAAKDAAAQMTPYIKASAVTGMSEIMGILIDAVNTFAQQDISAFPTREAALEWLTQQ
jgi:hypothetical protein